METIGNFFQSIFDSYKDRIKSPLVGSFIITFLAWNWKIIPILFYSDWPIHCRIEWIETNNLNWGEKWYNYLIPFIISLFYVMVLPYVNLEIEKVLTRYSKTKLDKKNAAKLASYDQMEEEAKKERKVADAKAGTSEISTLNSTVKNLTDEITTLSQRHQQEVDRLKNNEKKSNEIVIELQTDIHKLTSENEKLLFMTNDIRAESERRFIPPFIKETLEVLTNQQKLYFVRLCDYHIFGNSISITDDPITLEILDNLDLFYSLDMKTLAPKKLTEKGEYIYHILKHTL